MLRRKTPPKYTIVTVVLNDKDRIEKTLQSAISQSYKPKEYIVIDGGSTDGTLDLIRKYESRISIYISEKDSGIYSAMNKGIRRATGEWVCFLNSGDVFVDNTVVEKVAAAIAESTGKPEIVYGNRLAQKPDGSYKEKVAGKPCNSHRMYFCHQSAFVRLPLLRKYTFDENHKMSADLKFFKQCYYNNHIFHHLPFPTIIYDRTGISKSERIRGLKDNIAVVREMDHGIWKKIFLLRLNLVIFWRRILGKK